MADPPLNHQQNVPDTQAWRGVSRTAHFTAAVWDELGLPAASLFVTRQGRWLRRLIGWGSFLVGLRGQYEPVRLFLAPRYLGLDQLLAQYHPAQVIELAAGLAPRGLNWAQTRGGRYIEVDQPGLVRAKRQITNRLTENLPPETSYKLVEADLTRTDLAALLQPLILTDVRTAIISEGMTPYLNEPALRQFLPSLRQLACELDEATVFLDFYLDFDRRKHGRVALAMEFGRVFLKLLRAPVGLFLRDSAQILDLLQAEGFRVEHLYSNLELAALAGLPPPPFALFYIARFKATDKPPQ